MPGLSVSTPSLSIRAYLRLRELLVASNQAKASVSARDAKSESQLPWMPTFPPSFNHWMSMSRLSSDNFSRNWVASSLLWLKYDAVWSSRIPLLIQKSETTIDCDDNENNILLCLLQSPSPSELAYVEYLRPTILVGHWRSCYRTVAYLDLVFEPLKEICQWSVEKSRKQTNFEISHKLIAKVWFTSSRQPHLYHERALERSNE